LTGREVNESLKILRSPVQSRLCPLDGPPKSDRFSGAYRFPTGTVWCLVFQGSRAGTIGDMADFREMARDPAHRRRFEKLLYLAAQRGDADLVVERLSWGIDPNCTFAKGRIPLIANVGGSSPSTATERALLDRGADLSLLDELGLTALDYARRKLARIQAKPRRRPRKSPSLDENDQLWLEHDPNSGNWTRCAANWVATHRSICGSGGRSGCGPRDGVFNDLVQVERIVEILEGAGGRG